MARSTRGERFLALHLYADLSDAYTAVIYCATCVQVLSLKGQMRVLLLAGQSESYWTLQLSQALLRYSAAQQRSSFVRPLHLGVLVVVA